MTEKLKQKMTEEITKLPKDNQDAINSVEWVEITNSIGKKFLLDNDEIENLQLETGLILIGMSDLNTYTSNIENILVSSIDTKKILSEIIEKIMTPIANKIELSIKNKIKTVEPRWDQRIDFILSGGDYSFFVEKPKDIENLYASNINKQKIVGIGNNFSI